jgi:hypothetical protein
MPVEHLAIVEGPMAGLASNGTSEGGELVERTKRWLVDHDVRPWWMLAGAGIGMLMGETKGKGAVIGAAFGSGMSILTSRTCRTEAPWSIGVETVGVGQIKPSGIEGVGQIKQSGIQGLGQIRQSGIQGLGAIEMTPSNMVGLAAAGLIGAYFIFGRG